MKCCTNAKRVFLQDYSWRADLPKFISECEEEMIAFILDQARFRTMDVVEVSDPSLLPEFLSLMNLNFALNETTRMSKSFVPFAVSLSCNSPSRLFTLQQ
jgi:hypothetical protein